VKKESPRNMKMLARKLGGVLAATVAAVGLITAVPAPAQAANAEAVAYDPTYGDLTARSDFYDDPAHREWDWFSLWDEKADGHGVVLHINLSNDGGSTYNRWKNVYFGGGANHWTNFDAGNYAAFNDVKYFAFRVCRQDGVNNAAYHCGAWVHGQH
jgi:hypothetical protein